MFLKSSLDNIPGLGTKRIQKIWNSYESIDDLLKDSNSNIRTKTCIPLRIIKNIKKIRG